MLEIITTGVNIILTGIVAYVFREWLIETRELKKKVTAVDSRIDNEILPHIKTILLEIPTFKFEIQQDINKLRRSVGITNLGIRKWQSQINKIREDGERIDNKLETHEQTFKKALAVGRSFDSRIRKIESSSVKIKINDELFLIKGKKIENS